MTLRPSGTEPKVKLYFSAVRQVEEGGSVARAKEDAAGRLAALKKDFMLQVDEVLKS